MESESFSERLLRIILRLTAALMLLALVAVFMPKPWMAAAHEWLGLGVFPDAPIAEYLARSTSALYALVGGAMLIAASDVRRYARMITYLALAMAAVSVAIFVTCFSDLPLWWLLGDLVTAGGFAAIVLVLQHMARKSRIPEGGPASR